METFETVERLFADLGARLNNFENKGYLIDKNFSFLPSYERNDYSYLIGKIDRHIYGFNPKEALKIVKVYEKRAADILESLEPVQQWVVGDGPFRLTEPIPEKHQKVLWEDHHIELKMYLNHFQTYKKILSDQLNVINDSEFGNTKPETINQIQIQLPENFSVSDLNKVFEPQLNLNQAALFLYYLREQAILPPYSDSAVGKLAESFLVRNQKNITKSLTNIHEVRRNSADLTALKRVLEKLLTEVEGDLKKAR